MNELKNITVYEDKKSQIAYVSYYVRNLENGNWVRKKRSTKLKYNSKNLVYIQEKVIPFLKKQQEEQKGIFVYNRVNIEKVEIFIDELFKEMEKESRRVYTVRDYKKSLERHFLPKFGGFFIRDITSDALQNFFLDLDLSVKTKKNIKIPLSFMFKKAIRMNLISENPLSGLDNNVFKERKIRMTSHLETLDEKKKVIEEDREIDPFSEDEINKLLNASVGKAKNFFALLFFTGMRPSELIYLDWKNVDFDKKFLVVEGAITGKQIKSEEGLTKTYSSHRIVYLSDVAILFLREQYRESGSFNSKVFLTQRGEGYTSPKTFRDNYWVKLFDMGRKQIENGKERQTVFKKYDLNIRYREMYNLRHSFASINLSNNRLPLLLISKQLGHSTAEITLKKYSAYIVNNDEITLDLLNQSTQNFL